MEIIFRICNCLFLFKINSLKLKKKMKLLLAKKEPANHFWGIF